MKAGELLDHYLFGNLWVLDHKQGMVHQVAPDHWSPLALLPDLETRLVLCASLVTLIQILNINKVYS